MARYVVKLGSSIVAEDSGALRADVLARVCDQVAARHAAGDDVVVVTSGAIARGIRVMGLLAAPDRDRGPAGRQRGGPGQALPRLRRAAARARRDQRAGAADVLRHERAHALPQRAPDAAPAARLARRAGHQRERHDDDRRDLLRRQRLPRRAGRDPHRRRPARPAHRHRRPLHRRSAHRPGGGAGRGGRRTSSASTTIEIGHAHVAAGLGRHALEGRRGRDGDGGGHPGRHLQRPRRRRPRHGPRPASAAGTRFPAQQARYSSFKLWLRYAKPSHGTVVVDAGAARALREGGTSLLPVGIVEVRGGFDAGDAVHVAEGAAVIGKGISNYSAAELRRVMGMKSAAGARGAAAGDRRGRAPRLLRLGVIGRWPPPSLAAPCADAPPRAVAELCLAARDASRALAALPTGTQGRRAARDRRRAGGPHAGDPRGQRARHGGRARGGLDRRAARPARARRGAHRGDGRRRARDRRAARPGRRGHRRPAPAQRPRRAQGARAARRRRRRLRGAAERHDRRRRAVPEVGQRDRAARLVVGRALQRGARRGRRRGRGRRPACPRARSCSWPAAGARSWPSSPPRRASST